MLCKPVGGSVVVDSLVYCYSNCLGFMLDPCFIIQYLY